MAAFATIISIATYAGFVYTIPPPQCFANFNWNDCGKSPQPVMYYWKPGSRCEVGIWRGCLPNINMFKNEYECVSTCIFTVRAAAQDWHQINAMEGDVIENMPSDGADPEDPDVDPKINDPVDPEINDPLDPIIKDPEDAVASEPEDPKNGSALDAYSDLDNGTNFNASYVLE